MPTRGPLGLPRVFGIGPFAKPQSDRIPWEDAQLQNGYVYLGRLTLVRKLTETSSGGAQWTIEPTIAAAMGFEDRFTFTPRDDEPVVDIDPTSGREGRKIQKRNVGWAFRVARGTIEASPFEPGERVGIQAGVTRPGRGAEMVKATDQMIDRAESTQREFP